MGGFKVGTDRLPVVQDTLDAGSRDRPAIEGTPGHAGSSQCRLCASCQPLGNLLAGEIQRLDSKAAQAPCQLDSQNAPNTFDSARSVLAFPDFFIARLLHVSADKRLGFYVILASFEG